ncbi:unnamed protein product [Fraxinus pennsylvanica]|uniref:Ribosomal protein L19 n=1 Tax=Fraxinus pennsylvanica TaxID=56036 RepID=A0AAD1YNL3_9LAMI|nr:unnamed protein product [Fraxinus pennsylvanica]
MSQKIGGRHVHQQHLVHFTPADAGSSVDTTVEGDREGREGRRKISLLSSVRLSAIPPGDSALSLVSRRLPPTVPLTLASEDPNQNISVLTQRRDMQSLFGKIRFATRQTFNPRFGSSPAFFLNKCFVTKFESNGKACKAPSYRSLSLGLSSAAKVLTLPTRCMTTMAPASQDASASNDVPQRIKFKRLDKTARHIMQILDKEAVEEVKEKREIPDIRPGYIVQLKLEVPENKRRVQVIKGIVIAKRNAGLSTTFRIRRLVAGVGVESLFPLYSPNLKEIKIVEIGKGDFQRAQLYGDAKNG